MESTFTLKYRTVAVILVAMANIGVAGAITPRARLGAIAQPVTVHAHLDGHQEVPPVKTPAKGHGTFEVSSNGTITGTVTTHAIRGNIAHIHEGAPGRTGPAIITLAPGAHNTWVVPKGSKLNPKQIEELRAGDLYVNVHSGEHRGGEIRGQLKL